MGTNDTTGPGVVKRRRSNTTARLLDAALDVFCEVGFVEASVEAICARAGISRGAFYSNYRSKEELFFALFDHRIATGMDEVCRSARGLVEARPTVEHSPEAVAAVIDAFSAFRASDARWFRVVAEFRLSAARVPALAARYREVEERFQERFATRLEILFHTVGLRVVGDPAVVAYTIHVLYKEALTDIAFRPGGDSPGPSWRDGPGFAALVDFIHLSTSLAPGR